MHKFSVPISIILLLLQISTNFSVYFSASNYYSPKSVYAADIESDGGGGGDSNSNNSNSNDTNPSEPETPPASNPENPTPEPTPAPDETPRYSSIDDYCANNWQDCQPSSEEPTAPNENAPAPAYDPYANLPDDERARRQNIDYCDANGLPCDENGDLPVDSSGSVYDNLNPGKSPETTADLQNYYDCVGFGGGLDCDSLLPDKGIPVVQPELPKDPKAYKEFYDCMEAGGEDCYQFHPFGKEPARAPGTTTGPDNKVGAPQDPKNFDTWWQSTATPEQRQEYINIWSTSTNPDDKGKADYFLNGGPGFVTTADGKVGPLVTLGGAVTPLQQRIEGCVSHNQECDDDGYPAGQNPKDIKIAEQKRIDALAGCFAAVGPDSCDANGNSISAAEKEARRIAALNKQADELKKPGQVGYVFTDPNYGNGGLSVRGLAETELAIALDSTGELAKLRDAGQLDPQNPKMQSLLYNYRERNPALYEDYIDQFSKGARNANPNSVTGDKITGSVIAAPTTARAYSLALAYNDCNEGVAEGCVAYDKYQIPVTKPAATNPIAPINLEATSWNGLAFEQKRSFAIQWNNECNEGNSDSCGKLDFAKKQGVNPTSFNPDLKTVDLSNWDKLDLQSKVGILNQLDSNCAAISGKSCDTANEYRNKLGVTQTQEINRNITAVSTQIDSCKAGNEDSCKNVIPDSIFSQNDRRAYLNQLDSSVANCRGGDDSVCTAVFSSTKIVKANNDFSRAPGFSSTVDKDAYKSAVIYEDVSGVHTNYYDLNGNRITADVALVPATSKSDQFCQGDVCTNQWVVDSTGHYLPVTTKVPELGKAVVGAIQNTGQDIVNNPVQSVVNFGLGAGNFITGGVIGAGITNVQVSGKINQNEIDAYKNTGVDTRRSELIEIIHASEGPNAIIDDHKLLQYDIAYYGDDSPYLTAEQRAARQEFKTKQTELSAEAQSSVIEFAAGALFIVPSVELLEVGGKALAGGAKSLTLKVLGGEAEQVAKKSFGEDVVTFFTDTSTGTKYGRKADGTLVDEFGNSAQRNTFQGRPLTEDLNRPTSTITSSQLPTRDLEGKFISSSGAEITKEQAVADITKAFEGTNPSRLEIESALRQSGIPKDDIAKLAKNIEEDLQKAPVAQTPVGTGPAAKPVTPADVTAADELVAKAQSKLTNAEALEEETQKALQKAQAEYDLAKTSDPSKIGETTDALKKAKADQKAAQDLVSQANVELKDAKGLQQSTTTVVSTVEPLKDEEILANIAKDLSADPKLGFKEIRQSLIDQGFSGDVDKTAFKLQTNHTLTSDTIESAANRQVNAWAEKGVRPDQISDNYVKNLLTGGGEEAQIGDNSLINSWTKTGTRPKDLTDDYLQSLLKPPATGIVDNALATQVAKVKLNAYENYNSALDNSVKKALEDADAARALQKSLLADADKIKGLGKLDAIQKSVLPQKSIADAAETAALKQVEVQDAYTKAQNAIQNQIQALADKQQTEAALKLAEDKLSKATGIVDKYQLQTERDAAKKAADDAVKNLQSAIQEEKAATSKISSLTDKNISITGPPVLDQAAAGLIDNSVINSAGVASNPALTAEQASRLSVDSGQLTVDVNGALYYPEQRGPFGLFGKSAKTIDTSNPLPDTVLKLLKSEPVTDTNVAKALAKYQDDYVAKVLAGNTPTKEQVIAAYANVGVDQADPRIAQLYPNTPKPVDLTKVQIAQPINTPVVTTPKVSFDKATDILKSDLGPEIGNGSRKLVYEVPNDSNSVAAIWKNPADADNLAQRTVLMKLAKEDPGLSAVPKWLGDVYDDSGNLIGIKIEKLPADAIPLNKFEGVLTDETIAAAKKDFVEAQKIIGPHQDLVKSGEPGSNIWIVDSTDSAGNKIQKIYFNDWGGNVKSTIDSATELEQAFNNLEFYSVPLDTRSSLGLEKLYGNLSEQDLVARVQQIKNANKIKAPEVAPAPKIVVTPEAKIDPKSFADDTIFTADGKTYTEQCTANDCVLASYINANRELGVFNPDTDKLQYLRALVEAKGWSGPRGYISLPNAQQLIDTTSAGRVTAISSTKNDALEALRSNLNGDKTSVVMYGDIKRNHMVLLTDLRSVAGVEEVRIVDPFGSTEWKPISELANQSTLTNANDLNNFSRYKIIRKEPFTDGEIPQSISNSVVSAPPTERRTGLIKIEGTGVASEPLDLAPAPKLPNIISESDGIGAVSPKLTIESTGVVSSGVSDSTIIDETVVRFLDKPYVDRSAIKDYLVQQGITTDPTTAVDSVIQRMGSIRNSPVNPDTAIYGGLSTNELKALRVELDNQKWDIDLQLQKLESGINIDLQNGIVIPKTDLLVPQEGLPVLSRTSDQIEFRTIKDVNGEQIWQVRNRTFADTNPQTPPPGVVLQGTKADLEEFIASVNKDSTAVHKVTPYLDKNVHDYSFRIFRDADNKIQGVVAYKGDYIETLLTNADNRNSGVGSALIRDLQADHDNIRLVAIPSSMNDLSYAQNKEILDRFYRQNGFVKNSDGFVWSKQNISLEDLARAREWQTITDNSVVFDNQALGISDIKNIVYKNIINEPGKIPLSPEELDTLKQVVSYRQAFNDVIEQKRVITSQIEKINASNSDSLSPLIQTPIVKNNISDADLETVVFDFLKQGTPQEDVVTALTKYYDVSDDKIKVFMDKIIKDSSLDVDFGKFIKDNPSSIKVKFDIGDDITDPKVINSFINQNSGVVSKLIGTGSQASVFETKNGTIIKIFKNGSSDTEQAVKLMQARGAGIYETDAFPKIYGRLESVSGYEMSKVDGVSLGEYLAQGKKLSPDAAQRAKDNLRLFHERTGTVFADIPTDLPSARSSGNLIVTPKGEVVFIDPAKTSRVDKTPIESLVVESNRFNSLIDSITSVSKLEKPNNQVLSQIIESAVEAPENVVTSVRIPVSGLTQAEIAGNEAAVKAAAEAYASNPDLDAAAIEKILIDKGYKGSTSEPLNQILGDPPVFGGPSISVPVNNLAPDEIATNQNILNDLINKFKNDPEIDLSKLSNLLRENGYRGERFTPVKKIIEIALTTGEPVTIYGKSYTADQLSSMVQKYNWYEKLNMVEHITKHAEKLGYSSAEDYLEAAKKFIKSDLKAPNSPIESYVRNVEERDGWTVMFNRDTLEFAVTNENGIILSYYKLGKNPADGLRQYLKDKGNPRNYIEE